VKNLKPNFFHQLTITFLQAVVPLITFPYLSRTLGPDNIGKINYIDYILQFLLIVAAFGIPMYGAREVAQLRNNKEGIRKVISELVCVHLVMTLVSLVLLGVTLYFSPSVFRHPVLMALAVVNLTVNALSLDWLIQGLEDFAFLSKRTVVIRLLVVVALFAFIRHGQDFALYYTFLVMGSVLLIATDLFYAYRKGFFFVSTIQPWRHLKPLSVFFFTTAAISIYLYLDTFILGLVAGSFAVGFYTTALKTVKLSQNFVNDLGGVLLPRISYLYEAKAQQEIQRIINKSLLYVVTIAIPLGVFFLAAAPEIIFVLSGSQ
jgi:O-antigen/teichoic acid export membrane protein